VNKTIAIAAGALGAFLHVGTAAAEPAWCKGASFSDEPDLKDLSSNDPEKVMTTFALAACKPTPEVTAHAADIEKNRAAWGKRMGMTENDWADMVAWIAAGEGRSVKLEYSTKDISKFTPIDNYKAIVDGFARGGGEGPYRDTIYVADMLDRTLGEVGRFAVIGECLKASTSVTSSAPPAAEWAICQGDVEKFDLAKFHAELRADAVHGGDAKMMLRFRAFGVQKQLKDHAAAVEKAWGVDPVYKKMFDVSAEARRDWAGGLGKNTALLDLALQLDSAYLAGSRKQFDGCEDKTSEALVTAVGKIPASTFAKMKDERFDPFGGFAKTAGPVLAANPEVALASIPYILCRPKMGTADFLAYYLQDTVAPRGPRSLALAKMLGEKLTLDDMNERLYWPSTLMPYRRSGGVVGSAGGVIAKTKIEGDFIIVELERFIVKRKECVQSHTTKKISRILPDGTLEYERICDKMGIVSYDQTWADFKIKKVYAPLLKKGVKFSAVNGYNDKGADVIVLWPNKKTEMPNWLLGARIK
jgi:hypothetical protein